MIAAFQLLTDFKVLVCEGEGERLMKTINQALTLGLAMVLAACGNKNNNVVPPPGQVIPPAPVAPIGGVGGNPTFGPNDWVGGQVIPYMQNQYGNLALSPNQNGYYYGAPNQATTVTIAGVAFPMNQFISWAQMYGIVQQIVTNTPGCAPQNFGSSNPMWNQVNYGCVYNVLNSQDYNTLNNTWVRFERTGPTYYMTFGAIFDTLLGSNYSHYSQTQTYNPYQSQYGYGNYGYNGYTGYGYNNQYLGSANSYYNPNAMFQGGFGISGGSNGWGGNFGGVFNFR